MRFMRTEINYCRAGAWALKNMFFELDSAGIKYRHKHDDVGKCGTFVVPTACYDKAAAIVIEYSEMRS